LGEYAEALAYHERALALKREVGDWPGEGISLVNVGASHEHLGDLERALVCYAEALELARRTGERYTEADALRNLGEVRRKQGDHARAMEHLAEALEVCRGAGLRQVEADARIALGRTLASAGDIEGGLAQLDRALEGAREIQARVHVYEAHRALSELHERRGDLGEALRHFKAFHEAEDEVFSADAEKRIQGLLVQAEMERSQREAELLRVKNDELTAANRALREADEEKARLLAQLRRQAEALERLAREDALTGLSNRRHVDERLALEWERARRFGRDLTVVMADLDHFKEVNDRFSHAAGDAVLRALGRLLRERTRGIDVVGRYGGEEFVLLLVETPPEKAERFCEKLRAAVEAHDWDAVHPGVRVTMSLGLSGDLSVESPEALLAAADAKLYEAKRAGRNRVRG
ncbi:MAG TPA: diguanylate cyclase, partial [Longimicrobium sp.]|nr:diguanylate cyclase [Longimicrobium sp.]